MAESYVYCNEALRQIKLPRVVLQSIHIIDNQAVCTTCSNSYNPTAENVMFHIMVCNGVLIEEKFQTEFKMNCLLCNYTTTTISDWKTHLFKIDHLAQNDPSVKCYSYDCYSCKTHLYGYKDIILNHQCRPTSLSTLSELMAYVHENFNILYRRMLYYCANCLHFSHNFTDLHINNCCNNCNNSEVLSICNSCDISFYDSSKTSFFNHRMSAEHQILWCINGRRKIPEVCTTEFTQLPIFITKYFIINLTLQQANCLACTQVFNLSYAHFYDHFKKCISSKNISDLENNISLRTIRCKACNFLQSALDNDDMYKCWVEHVISFEHLYSTSLNEIEYKLKSYYCYKSKTIFYGSEDFIMEQISKKKRIKTTLFLSGAMADRYRRHLDLSLEDIEIMFCCSLCQSFTCNESNYCKHSSKLQYCNVCLIAFTVMADYNEHIISSEHIILKYFTPNRVGKQKFLEYYAIDMYNLTILKFINILSTQPIKSALNRHFKTFFEIMYNTPQALDVCAVPNIFFCDICDLILPNDDDMTTSRHNAMFHLTDNIKHFDCEICGIGHSKAYDTVDHILTTEHKLMAELHELKTNNKSYLAYKNLTIFDNTRMYIRPKDIYKDIIFNKYYILINSINKKYGEYQETTKKCNSFVILIEDMHHVENFIGDHHGYKILQPKEIDQNKKKRLSFNTIRFLSDPRSLLTAVSNRLESMRLSLKNPEIQDRINKLCGSVLIDIEGINSVNVYIVGARVYGLATQNNYVGLYMDVGNTFSGDISNFINIQNCYVNTCYERCILKNNIFGNVKQMINSPNTPIFKFLHIPTNLNCNVSFKSGLCVYKSKLINFYLSMDHTVKLVVCYVVIFWAPQNKFRKKYLFTNYTLIWLILFYFIYAEVVPSVAQFVENSKKKDPKTIEGWNCTFETWSGDIKRYNYFQLLNGFFKFYALENKTSNNVLCPLTGMLMTKDDFFVQFSQHSPDITNDQHKKFKSFKSEIISNFERHEGLVIQDPLELSHNMAKSVPKDNLTQFRMLCNETATYLKRWDPTK